MENTPHDTHQIYFERYLRNKMTVANQKNFEAKIANEPEFKLAFENYKIHRKEFFTELINDHDVGPRKTKLATYFYLVITLVGIAVALSFYFENQTLKEEINKDKRVIRRLISYVPFIGKKLVNDTADIYLPPINKSIPKVEKANIPEAQPALKQSAIVVFDTVFVPLKRSYFDERMSYYINEIDSNLTRNELFNLIYNNSFKYDIKHKTKPIGVLILIDQEQGNTYKFDGYKLIVIAKQLPGNIILVRDEGELIWLKPDSELILNDDNQAHSY